MSYVNQAGIDTFISEAQQKLASLGVEITEASDYGEEYRNKLELSTELLDLVEALSDPYLTWDEGFVFKVIDYYRYKADFSQYHFLDIAPYKAPSLTAGQSFSYIISHTYYDVSFDITDSVNNFINKAQQKIAQLGVEITEDFDYGNPYQNKLQLITEMNDLIEALTDPLCTWSSDFREKVIGYYYWKAELDQFFFVDIVPYKTFVNTCGFNITIDVDLSEISTNPVENRAITTRIVSIEGKIIYTNDIDDSVTTSQQWGNIPSGTRNDTLTNREFSSLITQALFTDDPAYVGTNKSVTLNGVSSQDMEVGATFTPSLSFIFNRGEIRNGDDSVAGPLVGLQTGYQITEVFGGSSNVYPADTLPNLDAIVGEGSNYFSIVLNHAQGDTDYYTKFDTAQENPQNNLAAQEAAGTANDNSGIITGKFNRFFGYSAETSLTSAQILALASQNLATSKVATYTGVTAGAGLYTYYVYRASYGDLNNVIMDNAAPILGAFTKLTDVSVTNQYGVVETYRVYRSNATQAFTGNELDFS